ncbi:hypothetical protein ABIE71_002255 [Bradyrhizobium diazoefficiens]
MPIPVWITVDFFFRDWDKNNNDSAVWLCLQPHVERSNLESWIRNCSSLSNMDHRLWTNANPIDPKTLIPVPLPGDTNVTVTLKRDATVVIDRLNERLVGPRVTKPDEFASLNQVPQPLQTTPPYRPFSPTFAGGPFARVFTDELQSAYRQIPIGDPSIDPVAAIADQLQLAFHGGTTRHFKNSCLDRLDAVDLFELDPSTEPVDDPDVRISNQHSLLGLQFILAKRSNAGLLATAGSTSFVIQLTSSDGTMVDLDLVASIPNPVDLDNWLDWFAQPTDVSSPGQITPTAVGDFDHRIYVHDAPEAFAQLAPKSPFWRRRTQEPGRGRPLSSARRFVVRPAKQADPPSVQTLRVQPFVAFDCELRPYRRCNIDQDPGPLHLRPKPQSRARFAASFSGLVQPAGMVVLGADATNLSYDWLGAYVLPWDTNDPRIEVPTVLFWGLPTDRDVTVLVPSTSTVMECEWRDDEDQLGRRWEPKAFAPSIDNLPFDALQIVDSVSNVIPGVIFPDSINFASARSFEAIEGVLRVIYPHNDATLRQDPPDDYVGDLVNYNALNVRRSDNTPCAGELLNKHGYDFAVWHKMSGNVVEQTFHYRFGFNSDPDITQTGLPDVGKFFDDQYKTIGKSRPLDFELTHTYGTSICLGKLDSAANPHARLPILPNEVATKTDGTPNSSFMTVQYAEDKNAKTDIITLHFDDSVFNPTTPSNDDERRSQQMRIFSAYRSLAELGYAQSATLKARGCAFDFSKLVGKGLKVPLAYGLLDDSKVSNWSYDLSSLASQCRKRLTDKNAALDLVITLSQADAAMFRNCNLIEFRIEVARATAASPIDANSAIVLRLSNSLGTDANTGTHAGYGPDGQIVDVAYAEDISAYPTWQSAMSARSRPLVPQQSFPAIRDVFASGSDADSLRFNSGVSWLAPPDAPKVTGDWPHLYAFPVGFLPLQRSPALGSTTTAIARKFFDALAYVVDARPGTWNQTWSIGDWRTHFGKLQSSAPNLVAAQRKALELLQPVNDPKDLDAGNPVTEQIRAFLQNGSRWSAAINQLVVESPGIFGSAKAIQITGIGQQNNSGIRPDLFRISQNHFILSLPASGTSGERTTEVPRSTDVRQGLPDPNATGSFFGIDVLDDVSYGNRYRSEKTTAQSFESLVDPGAPATPVKIFVPKASGNSTEPVVALPSREPLTPPQHFFTGVVVGAETSNWWDAKDAQNNVLPISASSLINHQISHKLTSPTDALEFIAGGSAPHNIPAGRIDRGMVCGVFSVSSDEEGSFENDLLSVLYDPSQAAGTIAPEDNNPDGFFGSLLSVPLLERNSVLNQVTESSNISIISDALKAASASSAVPTDACAISVDRQTLKFGKQGANDGFFISAALYRQTKTSGSGTFRAFLIVTLEVPVWQVVKLGLYHSRDIISPDADVPPFAEAFGQTLGPIGSDVTYLNEKEVSLTSAKAGSVSARVLTPLDLVDQLLVDPGLIDGSQWSDKLVEVTIHHRQIVTLMADAGGGRDDLYSLDTRSRFALVRSELKPGQNPSASELFPSSYNDFSVDFIWHLSGNEFFRIMDVPVLIP